MHRIRFVVAASLVGLATGTHRLPAQEPAAQSGPYRSLVPYGAFVDLDSGVILPRARVGDLVADLRCGRDGGGLFVEGLRRGLQLAEFGLVSPKADGWQQERFRIRRQAKLEPFFAVTDRGVARVNVTVLDHYSAAPLALDWVIAPAAVAHFAPAPVDLTRRLDGDELTLAWSDAATSWIVDVHGKDSETGAPTVARHVVAEPKFALPGLGPEQSRRVLVRGITGFGESGDGPTAPATSLPAEFIVHGAPRPARRAVTEFHSGFYDRIGGLRLTGERPEPATAAEVVFFLYGVHVPGGGVARIGAGEHDYRRISKLPELPMPPVYDRLDANTVLAVELADGRCAKLWLEPIADDDLRAGMRVHSTFLADGRRAMQAPPRQVTAEMEDGVITVSWQPAPGAVEYRAEASGMNPVNVRTTSARWPALADRLIDVRVVARSAIGEVSEPATTRVHTFGDGVQLRRATLTVGTGIAFATGLALGRGRGADLTLIGGAGGSQVLNFRSTGSIHDADDRAFDDLSVLGEPEGGQRWSSDARRRGADRFYVHTENGGCASVRIVERGWPKTIIEYLYRPKPE